MAVGANSTLNDSVHDKEHKKLTIKCLKWELSVLDGHRDLSLKGPPLYIFGKKNLHTRCCQKNI